MSDSEEDIISTKRTKVSKSKQKDIKYEDIDDENWDNHSIDSKDSLKSVIIDDKNNRKLFRKAFISARRQALRVYSVNVLMNVCKNAFAFHRFSCGAKLMTALVRDLRTSHLFIVKSAFILFTQERTNCSNNSSLLLQSMKKMMTYELNKKEIMLEIIINFIRNDNRIEAKSYIESNERILNSDRYRKDVIIDSYLKCYICFIDFMEWKELVAETNDIFYHSNRLIAEKAKLSLKKIITDTKDLNLDIFVLILVEMFEFAEEFANAIELLETYIDNNSYHLNAYIYLYNFSLKYPDLVSTDQQIEALKHIFKFSPENALVLDLIGKKVLSIEREFELLMEFVGYYKNFDDINAWILLKDLIICINDEKVKKRIVDIWEEVYDSYWVRLHCNLTKIKQIDENSIELIRCKQQVITFFYSSSHSYVIQTNQMIDDFNAKMSF